MSLYSLALARIIRTLCMLCSVECGWSYKVTHVPLLASSQLLCCKCVRHLLAVLHCKSEVLQQAARLITFALTMNVHRWWSLWASLCWSPC